MIRHYRVFLALAVLVVVLASGCEKSSDPKLTAPNSATMKALNNADTTNAKAVAD
ncbi:MAG TPA: hypothetical protein VGG61_09450 [Gemmataceae bacterium]